MEDYQNYQQSGIISGLDANTVSAMKAAETNWNDAFKNGATTDTFRQQSEQENMSGIANGLNNSAQLIESVITPNLVSYTVSYITTLVFIADISILIPIKYSVKDSPSLIQKLISN